VVSETKRDKIKLGALWGVYWRAFFIQALWNYRGMQNMGFLFAMDKVLRRLYKGEDLTLARLRHSVFFNTHPYMANAILGDCIHYEVNKQPEEASALKGRFIGALGATGDNLFWNGVRPALVGFSLLFGPFSPFIFIVLYNLIHLPSRLTLLYWGWLYGDGVVGKMAKWRPKDIIKVSRVVSLIALGAILPIFCWEGSIPVGAFVLLFAGLGFFLSKYRIPNQLIWLIGLVVMVGISYGF